MTKAKRNDPCPCGSGKKYKKCCFQKDVDKSFTAKVLSDNVSKLNSFFQNNIPLNQSDAQAETKSTIKTQEREITSESETLRKFKEKNKKSE